MINITCHSIAIWQAIISKESFIIIACWLKKSKKILPVKDLTIPSGLKCLEHTKVESVIWKKKCTWVEKNLQKTNNAMVLIIMLSILLFIFYQPINISSHHTGLLQKLHVVYMYYDMNNPYLVIIHENLHILDLMSLTPLSSEINVRVF